MKKEALRVSTTIPAAPTTLYYAWLNSEEHSQMTGATAKVEATVGAKFTAWNGYITGKLVILDLGRRIVMSWRTTDFPREAPDSRVEIHLEALGGSTRLTLLHTEIPEGQGEKYKAGWNDNYFTPMRTFFSKFLPDPRNPPPPRRPQPPPDEEEDEAEEKTPSTKKGPPSKKAPPSKKNLPPVKIAAVKPEKPTKPEKAPKSEKKAAPPAKVEAKVEKAAAKPEKKSVAPKPDKKKTGKPDKAAKKTKPSKPDKKAAKAKPDKKAAKAKPKKKK